MTTYVSMLRGINVGANKRIKMDDLRHLYRSLNFKDVKTFIQSGNVIFNSQYTNSSDLMDKIETRIKENLGFDVKVLIRTKNQLKQVIDENPFKKEDIKYLYVIFLSDTPSENLINELKLNNSFKVKNKSDKFFIHQKEIYIFLPNGYGKTKLNNNYFEKNLNVSATTRNWKTVNKLFDIAESVSEKSM
jgi:uncharacterized protein (DUF1697 family)